MNVKIKIKHLLFTLLIVLAISNIYTAVFHSANASQSSTSNSSFVPQSAIITNHLTGDLYAYLEGGFWGIYNRDGVVVSPQYDSIKKVLNLIVVEKNGLYGAINSRGKKVFDIVWDSISPLGYKYKIEKEGFYGWADDVGNIIKPPIYTYLKEVGNSSLYGACKDTGCGILYCDGRELIPLTLDGIIDGISGTKVLFSLRQDDKYAIVDIYGTKLSEYKYPCPIEADHNVVYTKSEKLKGLVRIHDEKELAPPVYQNIVALEQKGFYKVKSGGKWGVLSYEGEFIYPCKYGTFEINRMMQKYSNRDKYNDLDNYNYYYSRLLEGYYYLSIYGSSSKDAKKAYKEVLSVENKNQDLKYYAQKVINENGIKF